MSSVTLELFELRKLFADAVNMGAKQALIDAGIVSPVISATQAHDLYGRKTVERWVNEGLIQRIKSGTNNSAVKFDRIELEVLSKSSNRLSYFRNLEQSQVV